MGLPLQGLRAIDLTQDFAGPFCTMILSDLGAEVIKIERPGAGDETRAWGPPFLEDGGSRIEDGGPPSVDSPSSILHPLSAYYLSCNRNKRGLALDLQKPQGLEIFYSLVERSDILLENFRTAS